MNEFNPFNPYNPTIIKNITDSFIYPGLKGQGYSTVREILHKMVA